MNRCSLAILITTLVLLCAPAAVPASTIEYNDYQGGEIVEGTGGTLKKVNGIDFWDNGTPNRKYKVIGIIDDQRDPHSKRSEDFYKEISKLAIKHGASGVVIINTERKITGANAVYGSIRLRGRDMTKLQTIQYVQ
jgi:hypothetical protein